MLKEKNTGKSPLLNSGRPKLEQVAIPDVGDLVQQMEAANAQAVTELNERTVFERPDRCRVGCSCDPCRDGNCSLHVERAQDYRSNPRAVRYDGMEPTYRSNYYRRTDGIDRSAWERLELDRLRYEMPRFRVSQNGDEFDIVKIIDPESW